MGHKAVKEGVKPRYDFFGNGFAFFPGVIRVVPHEQFPVEFFCFFY
jgi:hypothetical protein